MSQDLKVAAPPSKPLMVFDGDCGFCRRWIARWQRTTGDALDYIPFQDPSVAARFPEIPTESFTRSVHLIEPEGSVRLGAEAVFKSLHDAGQDRWLYKLYNRSYGFSELCELLYEEVAEHRQALSKLDKIYSGPGTAPLSYIRTRSIFLRGLAIIYLIAFWSLLGQIQGLSGSHGVVPAQRIMADFKAQADQAHVGWSRYYSAPTFLWINASDAMLNWHCYAGIALSLCVLFGIAPAPALFLLWALYLSLSSVCSPFLEFQWDMLLLETGFLAIFFAPLQWLERPSRQSEPSPMILWLLRWLIFRLMIESGAVKLLSSDPTWWNLSALRVHFETQPLPTWIGWWFHQLPSGALATLTFLLFLIELFGPPLIFAGRKSRITAAVLFAILQVIILLTGNYTFFNWLTLLLCIPLLDDRFLRRSRPGDDIPSPIRPATEPKSRSWPRRIVLPITVVISIVTLFGLLNRLGIPERWPKQVFALYALASPLRSFNNYGLFAVMTTKRPEIILEGSMDGATWTPYEFKYKPGALDERPKFVAPYQPRLDWQMWFAALGAARDNPWFLSLEARLLLNEPSIVKLLKTNPFATQSPKFIRAQLYEYHFTDRATREKTGDWWRREFVRPYFPPIGLTEKR